MTNTNTTKRYEILGTTDKIGECDCCGRVNLQKTVMVAVFDALNPEGRLHHFGTGCAASAAAGRLGNASDVRRLARAADNAAEEAAKKARQAEADARFASWSEWYLARTGVEIGSRASFDRGDMGALRREYAELTAAR